MSLRRLQIGILALLSLVLLVPSLVHAQEVVSGYCIDGYPAGTGCDLSKPAFQDLCANLNTGLIVGETTAPYSAACNSGSYVAEGDTIAQAAAYSKATTSNPQPNTNTTNSGSTTTNPGTTTTTPTSRTAATTPSVSTPECDATYNVSANGLCVPKNPTCVNGNDGIACDGNVNITALLAKVISYMLFFAGIIAVVFIIIGGYQYMTSAGSDDGAKKGRKTLQNAIIGLIIIIMAYIIVTVVVNFLTSST